MVMPRAGKWNTFTAMKHQHIVLFRFISPINAVMTGLLLLACFTACAPGGEKGRQPHIQINPSILGEYVNADYARREEGYDWVAIDFERASDTTAYVNVHSRMDKKKPTCAYSGLAKSTSAHSLIAQTSEGPLQFTFKDNTVIVESPDNTSVALTYFCSGGASLAGMYTRHEKAEADDGEH